MKATGLEEGKLIRSSRPLCADKILGEPEQVIPESPDALSTLGNIQPLTDFAAARRGGRRIANQGHDREEYSP